MSGLDLAAVRALLRMTLAEDLGTRGDVTSLACVPASAHLDVAFVSRQETGLAEIVWSTWVGSSADVPMTCWTAVARTLRVAPHRVLGLLMTTHQPHQPTGNASTHYDAGRAYMTDMAESLIALVCDDVTLSEGLQADADARLHPLAGWGADELRDTGVSRGLIRDLRGGGRHGRGLRRSPGAAALSC